MSAYLLDTNICIHWTKNEYDIAEKLEQVGYDNCFISELTIAEMLYGVANSAPTKQAANRQSLNRVLAAFEGHVLPIVDCFELYATEKVRLRQLGRPLDDFDLLHRPYARPYPCHPQYPPLHSNYSLDVGKLDRPALAPAPARPLGRLLILILCCSLRSPQHTCHRRRGCGVGNSDFRVTTCQMAIAICLAPLPTPAAAPRHAGAAKETGASKNHVVSYYAPDKINLLFRWPPK